MKIAMVLGVVVLASIQSLCKAQGRTQFEVLQSAFHSATHRASLQDFEADKWDHCIYVDGADPQTVHPTRVRTLQMNIPGGGPLLPGQTDSRVDLFSDPVVDRNIVSFFNSSYEVLNVGYFLQVLDGPNWRRMDIYGKRDGDILVFELATSQYLGPNAPMYAKDYGYCWNDSSPSPLGSDRSTPRDPARDPARDTAPNTAPADQLPAAPGKAPASPKKLPPVGQAPPVGQVPPPPASQVPPPPSAAKPKAKPVDEPKKQVPSKKAGDDTVPMPLPPPPGA